MRRIRRWRRGPRRGVSEVIGMILLIALTVTAGVILWSFRIYTPPTPPSVTIVIRSGGSNPVWGDPTDCQPWGYNMSSYPSGGLTGTALTNWLGDYHDGPDVKSWYGQCGDGADGATTGNYSTLNTSEFIISTHSPTIIPLSQVQFTFVCNNATDLGGRTILLNGTLQAMTWYPGVSKVDTELNAPLLGYCGNFNAASSAAANDLYSNRLGIFEPLSPNASFLENGDTFILYIHNGGYPLDFECVANAAGVEFDGENTSNGCQHLDHGNAIGVPQLDYDDYHGAPPWCFKSMGACTIYLTYIGVPQTQLAAIPVYSLASASGAT